MNGSFSFVLNGRVTIYTGGILLAPKSSMVLGDVGVLAVLLVICVTVRENFEKKHHGIVESDSSMNQILNYGENHFRLEIWSQISCLILCLKTAFHRMRKLKESIVHPPVKSVKPKIQ